MPRYMAQKIFTFTDKDGREYPIKEIPEIKVYQTAQVLKNLPAVVELDEIASRPEIWGEGAEYLAYAIFEHNIEKIMEAKFDLSKLKELKIPTLTEG